MFHWHDYKVKQVAIKVCKEGLQCAPFLMKFSSIRNAEDWLFKHSGYILLSMHYSYEYTNEFSDFVRREALKRCKSIRQMLELSKEDNI